MAEELCVKDIMQKPEALYCAPTSSLESVIKRLSKMEDLGINVDVIVAKDDTGLAGIMMPIDVFNALQPSYLSLNKGYGAYEVFWKGLFTQRCKRLTTKRVSEIMNAPEGLKPEDNLMRAANFFVKKKVDIAPVISDGELIGLVHSKTLFKIILISVA